MADLPHQTLSINSPDGPVQFTIDDLAFWLQYALGICINYSSQLGASVILLVVVLFMTRPEKRRSVVFVLNVSSLVVNIIRVLLGCLYYTGPFYEPYVYFTADFSSVPTSAKATSVAANTMTLLLIVLVETSLVFQVGVVCAASPAGQRLMITIASIIVALVAIGFRFAFEILASKAAVDTEATINLQWLANAVNITMTISICFFCLVFLWKLGHAIYQCRKLGLKQFGPMQAIFIMGCQTLILPAIFCIFQYVGDTVQLQTLVPTSVVLSLPLSAMWAAQQQHEGSTDLRPARLVGQTNTEKGLLDSNNSGTTAVELKSELSGKYSQYSGSEYTCSTKR